MRQPFLKVIVAAGAGILLLLLASSAAAQGRRALPGHVPEAVSRLVPTDHLPATQRLNLAIGLPLRNQEGLAVLLQELYDPASPNFHQWLTPEKFTESFGPTEQDYQAVADFAVSKGLRVAVRHPNRLVLDVEGAITDIEQAFHVTMRVYQHPTEARNFYAPDVEPSVDFAVPILHISGLDNFSLPRPHLKRMPAELTQKAIPNAGSGPGGAYQGGDFRAAYVPGVTNLTGTGQSVGLLQFDGYYTNDITSYETQTGLPNVPLVNVPIDGGVTNPGSGNGEVCLDIEMVMSMAPGIARIYVYEAPNPSPWVDLLSRMANDNLSKQLSCSWGGGGPDPSSEQIFKQMASQGQSFFNASGDSDAFTGAVTFPSDSTNITQVGGTTLTTTGPGGSYVSETVWNRGGGVGSSGGISTYYQIPVYQLGISMTSSLGSTTFRNIPDVALTGENVYVTYNNGGSAAFGGTSCAAPLWAGFIALVNQQAVARAGTTVGFINPAIYTIGKGPNYASAFHDTTAGNNFNSSSPSKYPAVAGYDLCTGWGTPSGSNLINALAGPLIVSNSFSLVTESCTNGAADPGETLTMNFGLKNMGIVTTSNLVATLQTNGGILSPSGPQTYGILAVGGGAVAMPFTFVASGSCGGTNTATLQLQDGAANLGLVTFSFRLGQPSASSVFSQSFDGVSAPALPAGWTTSTSGAQSNWVTSTALKDTSPNSAFSPDPAAVGINELDSLAFSLPPGPSQLSFRHNYNLEAASSGSTGYDGGVLEIRIGGGAYADILSAGGSFVSGGYTRTISSSYSNPLAGRQAWSGNSGAFVTTVVNLPAAASGQTVQLRWRCGTDNSVSKPGWYVDTVSISNSAYVCCSAPTGSAPVITLAPTNQTIQYSSNAFFFVNATGTPPLTCHWYFGTNTVPGATNLTATISNAGFAQAGNYSIIVSNPYGSATGGPVSLTVVDTVPPAITACASNLTISAGNNCQTLLPDLTSQVAASDASGPVTVTQNPAPGTSVGLGPTNITFTARDSSSNSSFCLATVTVADTTPPSILSLVSNVTLLSDTNCQAVLADLTSPSYIVATDSCSFVTVTQSPPAGTPLSFGTNVVILVARDMAGNATNCAVQVIVSGSPKITLQPLSVSVAPGGNAAFNFAACGAGPLAWQWQHGGTNLPGGTDALLSLTNVLAGNAGSYRATVTNTYGSATSAVATLTVMEPPVFQTVTWSNGIIFLNWTAIPGQTYQLQYQTNMLETNWLDLGDPLDATNTTASASDAIGPDPHRFYRVILLP